jgi:hypothetical protein
MQGIIVTCPGDLDKDIFGGPLVSLPQGVSESSFLYQYLEIKSSCEPNNFQSYGVIQGLVLTQSNSSPVTTQSPPLSLVIGDQNCSGFPSLFKIL